MQSKDAFQSDSPEGQPEPSRVREMNPETFRNFEPFRVQRGVQKDTVALEWLPGTICSTKLHGL